MPLVKTINFKDVYAKIKEVLFLLVLVLPYINEISNDQQPYAKYIYEVVHRRDGSSSEKDLEKVILYVPQDTIIQDFNLK